MGSVVDMGENLDTLMDVVSPTGVEIGNFTELPEDLGTCECNFEDNSFHMEVPAVGRDHVMASRGNGEGMEVSAVCHDQGVSCRGNGEGVGGPAVGHDEGVPSRGNGEDMEVAAVEHDEGVPFRGSGEDMEVAAAEHDEGVPFRGSGEDMEVAAVEHDEGVPFRGSGDDMEVVGVEHDQVGPSRGDGEDLEVDIVGDINPDEGEERTVERDCQDATENSSSFGCTDSGSASAEGSSDAEVESLVRDDNASLMGFDGLGGLFRTRKKKLTTHWRKFIRPLMWRCKWVELQIRELNSQASKYKRELAECDKRKKRELDKCVTEDDAIKSTPFVCPDRSVKVMKRMKRKRVEETVNLASHTSCHSLFSYFVKKTGADPAYLIDNHVHTDKTPFGSGEWSSLEFKNSDAFETILHKIEEAQVHVRRLRVRVDKVVRENADIYASDHPNSLLAHVNIEKVPIGSATSQWPSKKLVVPESAVSVVPESAVSVSGAFPLPTDQPFEKVENEILTCGRPVKEECNDIEEVRTQLNAEPQSVLQERAKNIQHVLNPNISSKVTASQDQPTPKVRSSSKSTTPKNKRKRGRRKARAGRWSKRSSG